MGAVVKILSPGILASLQDRGRRGYAGFGVPRSGAADLTALRLGNALLGNDPFEPAIEFRFLGPKITVEKGRARFGLTGDVGAELKLADGGEVKVVTPWQTVTLNEGDVLTVSPLSKGATGYLTVEGGFALTPVLGSCSTYARASLGGVTGQPLQASDLIETKVSSAHDGIEKRIASPTTSVAKNIRVVLGPQDDYFSRQEIQKFQTATYKVSSDVDRMGIRLEGDELSPLPEKGSDLISDGLVPGSIQIPGSGQPIILFVDCQTIGGYPKIATVITADLPKLGQLVPGDAIQFELVSLEDASVALRDLENALEKAVASIEDYFGEGVMDLKALYQVNLIGGVVDASSTGHFTGHLENTNSKEGTAE